MAYRHEIEADWGEDVDGVYPPRLVDPMFNLLAPWNYELRNFNPDEDSFTLMGVDWDKYGAGVNIVVLEVCGKRHTNPELRGRLRLLYREEVSKAEYTLTNGVQRIQQLNSISTPKHFHYCHTNYSKFYSTVIQKIIPIRN
jgi:hypothetical protein